MQRAFGADEIARPHKRTTPHACGVDDDAGPTPNPVPGVGHFKATLLGNFWRAAKCNVRDRIGGEPNTSYILVAAPQEAPAAAS